MKFLITTRRWTQLYGQGRRLQERTVCSVDAARPKLAAEIAGMPATARYYYRSFHGQAVDFTNEVNSWERDRRNWTTWSVRKIFHDRRRSAGGGQSPAVTSGLSVVLRESREVKLCGQVSAGTRDPRKTSNKKQTKRMKKIQMIGHKTRCTERQWREICRIRTPKNETTKDARSYKARRV